MIKETLQVDTNIKEVTEEVDKLIEKLREANSLADELTSKKITQVKLENGTSTKDLLDHSDKSQESFDIDETLEGHDMRQMLADYTYMYMSNGDQKTPKKAMALAELYKVIYQIF